MKISSTARQAIIETVIMVIIAVAVYVGMRVSVHTYIVDGPSMEPNYFTDEWVIVNRLTYKFHPPQRGDVIVFHSPYDMSKNFIKRVMGFPGEYVEVKDGQVIIYQTNGNVIKLNEPYIKYVAIVPYPKTLVPQNAYFVMGDNRNNSDDSRTGWTVSPKQIIGKAWLDVWPPKRWGLAPNQKLPGNSVSVLKDNILAINEVGLNER